LAISRGQTCIAITKSRSFGYGGIQTLKRKGRSGRERIPDASKTVKSISPKETDETTMQLSALGAKLVLAVSLTD